jgi:acyl carrier protein
VHAAGVPAAGGLLDTDLAGFADAMSAKVLGARYLDELLGDTPLDAFVLFSSIAGTWGSGGQSAYAAGSAYLDALAERRRSSDLAATSISWGPWAGSGMASDEETEEYLRRRGLCALPPDLAIAALGQAVDDDESCVTVADIRWDRFAETFTLMRPSSLLADLAEVTVAETAQPERGEEDAERVRELRATLAGMSETEQDELVSEMVLAAVAAVLQHESSAELDADQALNELGFDSLTAVDLRNRLVATTGLPLPATLAFDYPTADEVSRYLRQQLVAGEEAGVATLLAELDAVDASFATAAPDGLTRAQVAVRLRDFLSKWADTRTHAEETDPADLNTATDEEMIDIIERELGVSR